MFVTERKFCIFKILNIYFVEKPVIINIPDCDVVTYYTNKNWGDIKGYGKKKYSTTIINLNQDIDVIWRRVKRQHKRHIRRAEKNGTTITVSKDYQKFYQIYKRFLIQKKYAYSFGLKIFPLQFMQKYGILFISENQGEILGGNLYFVDEDNALLISNAYQLFGNSIDKNKQISDANCYIHWEAIQYFKNLGIINYDFGGLEDNAKPLNHQIDGLDYYKRSFGGDIISQYEYRKFNSRFNKLVFHSWNFLRTHKYI
jgi:lipid II:glycine glycyltransferase (peptidoglycan interpeptide bridge formation enzyme)